MVRINDILDLVHSYLPNADTTIIQKAYIFSAKVHQGQTRLSGEPYLSHPLAVTYILAQLKLDVPSIVAGLLHDTVEDTYATLDDIEELFGPDVRWIVDGVTKISQMKFQNKIHKQAENIRKMILAMSEDLRVLLVKLADRLHNMRTLEFQPPKKQERISRETLDIYAPLASRLGIDWIKRELEDLAFRFIYPDEYNKLRQAVDTKLGQRRAYVKEVKGIIAETMEKHGLRGKVSGRPKHLYSIFRKMRSRNLPLEEIYDIIAFRIVLKHVKECYEALGVIHNIWKPVQGRFKDYISLPKANMYQSLHTTVIGPYGERIEIQIRTEDMDKVAREGIAAHWLYKEGKILTKDQTQKFDWLKQLMEWQKELGDPREFLDSVRMDLFPNDVYVFTPKGEVKQFPKGATPVDFAYAIHTEVGNHCTGAKINGRIVPLKYQLKNGDVVEITTSTSQTPSRDWINIARTARARAKIRQWIKEQEKEKVLILGKDLLNREFKRHRIDFFSFLKHQAKEVATALSFKSVDDMLIAVGYGKIAPAHILRKIIPPDAQKPKVKKDIKDIQKKGLPNKQSDAIKIHGLDDILIHLARCCTPVPGDDIVGYITRGRGVTIHREDCPNVKNMDPERTVEATWEPTAEEFYPVRLKITAYDKKGLLAAISDAISKTEANIKKAKIQTTPDQQAIFHFVVEVVHGEHLEKVLSGISRVEGVIHVERAATDA